MSKRQKNVVAKDQKFLGFVFISDKEAKRYKVDGFYFIDEVFYEYKVSIDKIDFYSKEKGLGSDSHYSLDRAELFIYSWACEILDDSINLKELMEKKSKENKKKQEKLNKI